jgi:signal transduction histidine kinase
MCSQPADTPALRLARAEQFMHGAAYVSLALGYLLGVLLASHLTLGIFLAFTGVQIIYAGILALPRLVYTSRRFALPLYALVFSLLALASGLLGAAGIYWDWLLYVVTVALYFFLLSLRVALVSSALLYGALILNLAFLNHWRFDLNLLANWVSILAAFSFVGAFSLVMTLHQTQKERAEQLLVEVEQSRRQLETAHIQLRQYAEQVEELTIARERTRVAREIHDTLGHYLTILNVQLETISRLLERDPSRLAAEVAEARQVAAQSMQEVRNAVAALRPAGIATITLAQALNQLGNEFKRAAPETELTLDLEEELPPLAPDVHLALYRAAQEALTNVRKHAHASNVLVRLRYEESWLELLVLDNGRGRADDQRERECRGPAEASARPQRRGISAASDSGRKAEGFGLIGLVERVKLLGGQVLYGPATPDGRGYRVTIRVQASEPRRQATEGAASAARSEALQGGC